MIARAYRLRTAADFNKTYKHGRSTNADVLYVKVWQSHQAISRVAVVASKKVSKRAVVRNRCKRRVVEIVRKDWGMIKPGYNFIITIKQDISQLEHAELQSTLLDCLKRAQLYSEVSK